MPPTGQTQLEEEGKGDGSSGKLGTGLQGQAMEESSPSRANIYRGDGRKPGLINTGVGEGAPRDLELSGQQTRRGHQAKNLEK